MLFCGQCGLQLAPGSSACPRCGMVTQPELSQENLHLEDPTIASDPRLPLQHPSSPQNPQHQQNSQASSPPLVLRPDGSNPGIAGTGRPFSSDPTRVANGSPISGPSPYSTIDMRYQSSPPPVNPDYMAQRVSNPGFSQPGNVNSASNVNYPVSAPGFAQDVPITPPLQEQEPRRGRGGVIALFVVLLVLLLAISTAAILIVKPAFLFGSAAAPTATSTTITATSGPTAAQQAQAVVQQYFTDINNKDYQDAYNLWINPQCAQNPCTYTDFATGYANTIRDTVTITNTTLLSDGSVKVFVTLNAQETAKNSTYHGYYIIGQLNGKWKIVTGVLR